VPCISEEKSRVGDPPSFPPSLPPSLAYLLLDRVQVLEELGHDLVPLVFVVHQVDDGVRDLGRKGGREGRWVGG